MSKWITAYAFAKQPAVIFVACVCVACLCGQNINSCCFRLNTNRENLIPRATKKKSSG